VLQNQRPSVRHDSIRVRIYEMVYLASFCRETHKPFTCLDLHAPAVSGLQLACSAPGWVCCAWTQPFPGAATLGVCLWIGTSKR